MIKQPSLSDTAPQVILIPARMHSSRLPNKPLAEIAGKPMLWHVWQKAIETGIAQVVIATDHPHIEAVMRGFGADVVMTSSQHLSGTERLAEAAEKLGLSDDTVIINVQGDEPLIEPDIIQQVGQLLCDTPLAEMATLFEPIHEARQLMNPNVVKVVCDAKGFALTFSRAPIPWHRDLFGQHLTPETPLPKQLPFCRHLGIYAYRSGFLKRYAGWEACELEKIESLEQLRVLSQGYKIILAEACRPTSAGVDTAEDLARVRQILK